jgi:hypothetical protein
VNFQLRPKSEVTRELLDEYPVWAEYYEPSDVDSICEWGVPRDLVVGMLEKVGWSDEFIFPVLRFTDSARFQFFYALASFRTPSGCELVGYAFNEGPTSIGVFFDGHHLVLNQCAPEISEEDESILKSAIRHSSIYPLEFTFCAYDVSQRVLNPYER